MGIRVGCELIQQADGGGLLLGGLVGWTIVAWWRCCGLGDDGFRLVDNQLVLGAGLVDDFDGYGHGLAGFQVGGETEWHGGKGLHLPPVGVADPALECSVQVFQYLAVAFAGQDILPLSVSKGAPSATLELCRPLSGAVTSANCRPHFDWHTFNRAAPFRERLRLRGALGILTEWVLQSCRPFSEAVTALVALEYLRAVIAAIVPPPFGSGYMHR